MKRGYLILKCLFLGTKRFDSEKAGDREVQRTMLELLNQLDGFSSTTDIKVFALNFSLISSFFPDFIMYIFILLVTSSRHRGVGSHHAMK